MRPLCLLLVLIFASIAWCQDDSTARSQPLFLTVKANVTMVVRKHSTGADLVEITMLDANYPSALLTSQIQNMCKGFNSPPRGLFVGRQQLEGTTDPRMQFMKANFATDGIINSGGRSLNIQPIIRAFAGAPAPYTITGMTLIFDKVIPSASTLQRYDQPGMLAAEGRFSDLPNLQGLEYRIKLLTQDPNKITFPDSFSPSRSTPKIPVEHQQDNRTLLIVCIVAAGLAVGALVYFALLRFGRDQVRKPL